MYSFKEVFKFSKNLTILYAEDDRFLREETNDLLTNFFYKVDTAENGLEALKKYNNYYKNNGKYYDIVITDLNMPLKNGLSLIKDIIEINQSQSIIVISAHNESSRLINLIQEGINSFIMKPMNETQLMLTLYKTSQNIVNQKRINQDLIEKTKSAQMSEMVNSITNQWLEPINVLKLQTDLLEIENEDNSNPLINDFITTHRNEMNKLTNSIQEFRNFFKLNQELEVTTYKKLIQSVELLLKNYLSKNNIKLTVNINETAYIRIIANEFKHVIINIINNSIYGFIKNNIEHREIIIESEKIGDDIILNIKNNASEIPEDIISKIFNSDFTNKIKSNDIETSLYLSSILVTKLKGKLTVSNIDNGAVFKISLKEFKGNLE